jgi:peptidyl-prolyl cis-trans isomerase C
MIARRLLRLAAPVVAGAFVVALTGCGSSTMRDAATVKARDGGETTHITRDDLTDELQTLLGNEAFVKYLQQQGVEVEDDVTVGSDISAIWLSNLVTQVVVDDLFAERKLEIDEETRTSARQASEQSFGGKDVFEQFPEDFQETIVEREARYEAVAKSIGRAKPTEEQARRFYDENKEVVTACETDKEVLHILVETEAEANDLLAQLQAGDDFRELAAANSIDPGSAGAGGSLGCLKPGSFVKPFQEAADGAALDAPVGPVQSQYGYHLILVEKWDPSFEHLRDQIIHYLSQQSGSADAARAAVNSTIGEAFRKYDVDVDPRYGSWVTEADGGGRVEPPKPPEVRTEREKPDGSTTTTAVTGDGQG